MVRDVDEPNVQGSTVASQVRRRQRHVFGPSCALVLSAFLGCSSGLAADDAEDSVANPGLRLVNNIRLRDEHADDDSQPQDATAVTVRFRGAVEYSPLPAVTLLGEVEAVGELVDDFNDGRLNWSSLSSSELSRKFRPVIADPGGTELNRAQAVIAHHSNAHTTLGRQRIVLDDERFIGVSAFRQNDRTFDAIRFSTSTRHGVLVDAGYINRTKRVIRDDAGFGSFRGNSFFANVNVPTSWGRLGVFHYALDLETGPRGDRTNGFSNQTTGVRLDGRRYWGDLGLRWQASFAHQTDYADNTTDYSANYWLGDLEVDHGVWALSGRAEVLAGNDDDGGSFRTPLATLRRFQGAADIFFVTPDEGVIDRSVSIAWRPGNYRVFRDAEVVLRHHWFDAETSGDRQGNELDAEMRATWGATTFSAGLARYRTKGFASDTTRVFFSVAQAF